MGTPSSTPFSSSPIGNVNRVRRVTFMVGAVKTASHVVEPTGSKARYDAARPDSTDPQNIQVFDRNDYITEEA